MKCSQCSLDLLVVAGKFLVCPTHGQIGTVEIPQEPPFAVPPTRDLQRLVLERFPFPIAFGYRQMVGTESASHAIECAFYTYTALLRLPALIFLSQFLRGDVQNPQAAKAAQRLRMPTLESWFTALVTLAKQLFPVLPGKAVAFAPLAQGGPFAPGLAGAARTLAGLAVGETKVHERLRELRNSRAHGAPWDEGECRSRLPEIQTLLEAGLEHFHSLADVELLRKSPQGFIRLVGAESVFVEENVSEVRLEDLLGESDTALRNAEGDLLPLYPLFLGGDEPLAQGFTEPLLSFDGHDQRSAVYLGVRSRNDRQDVLPRYLDLLRAKDIDPRFTKAELAPWNVTQWAREASLGTVDNLRGVKYFPAFYTERKASSGTAGVVAMPGSAADGTDGCAEECWGVDDAVARWLDRGGEAALVVAAEAGSGKTSLLCRTAEKLLEPDRSAEGGPASECDCVLLVLGASVRGRETLFARVREALGFSDNLAKGGIARFDELLDAWLAVGKKEDLEHASRRLVLLVDAVNEADDPKALFEELAELAAMAARANRRAAEESERRGRAFVRLVVSVRAERIEILLDRWQERHDTAFLQHPENFAHFPDHRGRPVPYLSLRAFSIDEAGETYTRAQDALSLMCCPVPWSHLPPATRELLRRPLLLRLFHEAFAGNVSPPSVGASDAVWNAWLGRTFSPEQGGARLETCALDLADACIDGGHNAVPVELAAQWRARWQADQGNDPVRIAAALDPMERLAEAGLLREAESGRLDWVSDSLAEQVCFRALRRRDPGLAEESLTAWLRLPRTERLDGALVFAGEAVWAEPRALGLRPLLAASDGRGRMLLGRLFLAIAPRGPDAEVAPGVEVFSEGLAALATWSIAEGGAQRWAVLRDALLRELLPGLEGRWGAASALRVAMVCCLQITEDLAVREPGNVRHLQDVWACYSTIGDLDEPRDPAKARESFNKAFAIAERLAELEPDNTARLRVLSISCLNMGRLGDVSESATTREWYDKAIQITERLVALDPDNATVLRDLSTLYAEMGLSHDLGESARALGFSHDLSESARAYEWYNKSRLLRERLAVGQPDDAALQRDLWESYMRLGSLDVENDPAMARRWCQQAVGVAEKLTARNPDDTEHLRKLAASYRQLGEVGEKHDPENARKSYQQAIGITEKLAVQEPDWISFQRCLILSYCRMGGLEKQGDPAVAREWYEKAIALTEKLLAQDPANIEWLRYMWQLYTAMADVVQLDPPTKVREWTDKAVEVAERLVTSSPDNTWDLLFLVHTHDRRAILYEQSDPLEADESLERSLALRETLAARQPDNTKNLYALSVHSLLKGAMDAGVNSAKARARLERGAEIAETLVSSQPDNARFLHLLSLGYRRLGDLDLPRDPAMARLRYEKVIATIEKLAVLEPNNPLALRDLAESYAQLGRIDEPRSPARARESYGKTLVIRERLTTLEPGNLQAWKDLTSLLSMLAELALRCEDHSEERRLTSRYAEVARRLVGLYPENGGCRYDLACALARSGDAAGALEALSACVPLGWTNADHAAQDADLGTLRGLPEFNAVLRLMRAGG